MGFRKPSLFGFDLDTILKEETGNAIAGKPLKSKHESQGAVPVQPKKSGGGINSITAPYQDDEFDESGFDAQTSAQPQKKSLPSMMGKAVDYVSTDYGDIPVPSMAERKPLNWKQALVGIGLPTLFGALSGAGAITTGAEAAGQMSDALDEQYKTDVNAELTREKELSERISDAQRNKYIYDKAATDVNESSSDRLLKLSLAAKSALNDFMNKSPNAKYLAIPEDPTNPVLNQKIKQAREEKARLEADVNKYRY